MNTEGWLRLRSPTGESVFVRVKRASKHSAHIEIKAPENIGIELEPGPAESKQWPPGGYAKMIKRNKEAGAGHAVT